MSVAHKWFYLHLSLLQTKRPPSHSYKQKDHHLTSTNKKTTLSLLQTKRPPSHFYKQKDHSLTPLAHSTLSLLQTKRPPSQTYKQNDHSLTPTEKRTPLPSHCSKKGHPTLWPQQGKGHPHHLTVKLEGTAHPMTPTKKRTPPPSHCKTERKETAHPTTPTKKRKPPPSHCKTERNCPPYTPARERTHLPSDTNKETGWWLWASTQSSCYENEFRSQSYSDMQRLSARPAVILSFACSVLSQRWKGFLSDYLSCFEAMANVSAGQIVNTLFMRLLLPVISWGQPTVWSNHLVRLSLLSRPLLSWRHLLNRWTIYNQTLVYLGLLSSALREKSFGTFKVQITERDKKGGSCQASCDKKIHHEEE